MGRMACMALTWMGLTWMGLVMCLRDLRDLRSAVRNLIMIATILERLSDKMSIEVLKLVDQMRMYILK